MTAEQHPPAGDEPGDETVPGRDPARGFSAEPTTRALEVRQVVDAAIVIIVVAAVFTGWLSPWWLLLPAFVIVANLAARRLDRRSREFTARFRRPGDHRVVLQVPGPRPVLVIRELRRILGVDLAGAKKLVDDAPVVLLEGVDHEAAAQAVYLLQQAGARATTHAVEGDGT